MKKITVLFLFVSLICVGYVEEDIINDSILDITTEKCTLIIKVSDFDSIQKQMQSWLFGMLMIH